MTASTKRAMIPGLMRWGAALALAAMLGGCATPSGGGRAQPRLMIEGLDVNAVNDVLVRGFGEIKDRAFDEPDLDTMFKAGLSGLTTIDPDFAITATDNRLTVRYRNAPIKDLGQPSRGTVAAWSLATLQGLIAGRRVSRPLMEADTEAIYQAVFSGAMTALDPYSRYATRRNAMRNRLVRDGVIGLGIRFELVENGALIRSLVTEGPGEIAGLDLDDVITHANGVALTDQSVTEVRRRLDGVAGTTITLTVLRRGDPAPRTLTASLDLVVPDTVTSTLIDGVLEVRIHSFNQRTAYAVERAVTTAQRENGSAFKGIVLDLRGAPGGLLDQAIDVADLFLEAGTIATLYGRHPGANQYYSAHRGDIAEGVPMAVVIDGKSASATEIVVAALQDNKRAVVVGTNSWGKGSVQTLRRLPNGGEIALTWARILTPRGADLHGLGLMPDVCLSGTPASVGDVVDVMFSSAEASHEARRRWQQPASDDATHERLRLECPAETHAERTVDIDVARRIVTDPLLQALATLDDAPQLAVRP